MLTKLTIERLEGVKAAILAAPRLYDQQQACQPDESCGTTGCLLGHAFALYADKSQRNDYCTARDPAVEFAFKPSRKFWSASAQPVNHGELILLDGSRLLGLDKDQALRLFSSQFNKNGVAKLTDIYTDYAEAKNAGDHCAAACAACDRIDHFIATGGDE